MFWNQYPYINLNDLNLDFLLKSIGEIKEEVENFVSINALKFANPIQWNITNQYEKNTIVIDPLTGTAYISVAPVPSGVALNNTDYWTVVFDLREFVIRAAKNFTSHYEEDTTLTATFNSNEGDWLVWGDVLYIATTNITVGDSYVIGGNIRTITVEEVKNEILQLIGDLTTLSTTAKSNLVAAINELYNAIISEQGSRINGDNNIIAMIGVLSNLSTTAKNNLVAAINELYNAIISEQGSRVNGDNNIIAMIGNLSNLNTTAKNNLVAAINEVNDATTAPRRIITIADSYGYHPDSSNSWQAKLSSIFDNATFYNYYEGSMGIYHQGSSGHNVEELITYYAPIIPDHDTITDIVIALGINDFNDTIANVSNAYDSLIPYCKTTFPKAQLWFGFAGYTHALNTAALVANYKNLIRLMMEKCGTGKARYISNIEYIMHDITNNENDMLHPNNNGAKAIAEAISTTLIGGVYHYRNTAISKVTAASGAVVNNAMIQTIDDNITTIKCENVYNANAMVFTGADFTPFGTIENPLVYNSTSQLYTSIFSNDASAPPAMTVITSGNNMLLSYTGAGTRTVNGVQINRFNFVADTLDV